MSEKDTVFDSSNLIIYMYRWRKPLIIMSVLAAIIASVFSAPKFIKPKYKATVVVFPATTNSVSKVLLPQQNAHRPQDILEFGEEEQAEQLLQILNSDQIRSRVIAEFNLIEHYDIDTTSKFMYTELFEEYGSNISFRRTEFMSVEIKVLDTDPQMAADIANYISSMINEVRNGMQKERAEKALEIVKGEYEYLKKEVKSIEDSLMYLRLKGVHDYEAQVAVLNEQLAVAMIEGRGVNDPVAKEIQIRLDTVSKYGGVYVSLRDEASLLREELIKMKTQFDQAKVDVEESLPHVFKVNDAYKAEKKTYPIRWLIVALATMGTFVFTLVLIIIFDTLRKAKLI